MGAHWPQSAGGGSCSAQCVVSVAVCGGQPDVASAGCLNTWHHHKKVGIQWCDGACSDAVAVAACRSYVSAPVFSADLGAVYLQEELPCLRKESLYSRSQFTARRSHLWQYVSSGHKSAADVWDEGEIWLLHDSHSLFVTAEGMALSG